MEKYTCDEMMFFFLFLFFNFICFVHIYRGEKNAINGQRDELAYF